MNAKTLVSAAVALVAGIAVGYLLPSSSESAPAAAADKDAAQPKQIAEVDDASVKALRARVKELEKLLADKQEQGGERREARVGGQDGEQRWPNGEELRANIEKFKQEHPEEYARMDKMRQDFLNRRSERAKSKLDFLASVDTSRMSKEALATHTRLQELINKRNNLEKNLNESLLDMSNEDRGNLFREMGETSREINELNQKERGVLFESLAQELGIQGDEAGAVSDAVQGILDATSNNEGFGMPFGGGFGGGRRGGRGPGGGR